MLEIEISPTYQSVDVHDVLALVGELVARGASVGLDTETTALDPWDSQLVTVQIGDGQTVYVADVRDLTEDERVGLRDAVRLLFSGRVEVLGHNLKFDVLQLAVALGIGPDALRRLRAWDTMLAEQVILGGLEAENGGREKADLASVAARYGIPLTKEPRSWFAGLDQRPEWHEPLPAGQVAYAARDVYALTVIRAAQQDAIATQGLEHTIQLEMACLPAVAAMELAGIAIDVPGWRSYIAHQRQQAAQIERRVQAHLWPAYRAELARAHVQAIAQLEAWKTQQDVVIAAARGQRDNQPKGSQPSWGDVRKAALARFHAAHPRPPTPKALAERLNLGSPVQLKDALALAGVFLADTAAATLEAHRTDAPVMADLLAWRKLAKIIDAFGEAVLAQVKPDGRLHPSWRQIGSEASGVSTGRMSCSSPNLQQVPAHDETDGDSIRRHIIAAPGCVLLSCDYSQIEPRTLAELSGDHALRCLFAKGSDLYTGIAVQMGLCRPGASKDECKRLPLGDGSVRDAAKTLTLACMYGMGPGTLADRLGCSLDEARAHLDRFFATFPGIAAYRTRQQSLARTGRYTQTQGGRRRNFRLPPEPRPHQFQTWDAFLAARQAWRIADGRVRRQAVNHTIQGTAADILKLALVLVTGRLPEGAQLIAAVHDELLIEARANVADEAARVLAAAMAEAARAYLPNVALGSFLVTRADYWRKAD